MSEHYSVFIVHSLYGHNIIIIIIIIFLSHLLTHSLGCTTGDIRLQGGANSLTGRVEICNNRIWGTVCDDSWGAADARVVCRQLQHSDIGETPEL